MGSGGSSGGMTLTVSGRKIKLILGSIILLYLISRIVIPSPQFQTPHSTVVLDANGYLLGARIADDGQWRFPHNEEVPEKFSICIRQFEDRYFNYHFGINPISIFRALGKNISSGRIKQGGSTITMQVARMLSQGKERTFLQKGMELFVAFHLEINYSKNEILALYASNAPFGGNVVGLEAASWRYFGRPSGQLSWAESAVLAVLPNSPSLIYPGKNQQKLRLKRNRLLDELLKNKLIDEETCALSKLEPIPESPLPLPGFANHHVDRIHHRFKGETVETTIDNFVQRRTQEIINRHCDLLSANQIYNAAAIVIDVRENKIISYVGNSTISKKHGNDVDVIKANRSTGSLLKPFLYAAMLSSGELLPTMLVPDIPTYIAGYSPKNYFLTFDGAVHADEALYRSLNVPFVRLLRGYGVERFYNILKQMNMSSLTFDSGHYGLSLILGGAEGKLLEMTSMYASLSRVLQRYANDGNYVDADYDLADMITSKIAEKQTRKEGLLSAGAIYYTLETLTQVNRPVSEEGWKAFGSARKIAWKTGTSFGNKDGWAIGITPEYVVGVWVGNADGEGRTGLTGVSAAAPVMFEIFETLGETSWFSKPFDDMTETTVCHRSGHRSSENCETRDTVYLPAGIKKNRACSYHQLVHLTKDEKYQVNMNCEQAQNMVHKKWFVLPPVQEWFYKKKSPLYKTLPPLRSDCGAGDESVMEFIYPKSNNKIFIPIELDGSKGETIFEVAHRNPALQLYWHLDGNYIGLTRDFHQKGFNISKGRHEMIVIDEEGNELIKRFEVLSD